MDFSATTEQQQPLSCSSIKTRLIGEMTQSVEKDKGFAGTAFKGAIFLTSLRWVVRLIGLVSISITARILTPEDFGIHSTATIIVGFFTILQYSGSQEFIVKRDTVTDSVINTSWTVRVGLTSLVTICILAISPFAPALLDEPRVFEVLLIYAFIPLVDALSNPRMMLLLRDMEFGTLFKMRLIERIIAFITLISSVIIFRSYWGIIIGAASSSIIFTLYTYLKWSYRPRFEMEHFKEVGGFASVALIRSFSKYIGQVSDSVAARQIMASDVFGGYHNSKDLARNLIGEIASSIGTALMPALSKMRADPSRFGAAACNAFGAIFMLASAMSVGLYLVSAETVAILLGEQWAFAVPYIRLAALIVCLNSLTKALWNFYIALDRQVLLTVFVTGRAVVTVGVAFWLVRYGDPMLLLYGVIAISLTMLLTLLVVLSVIADLGLRLFNSMIRPGIAIAAMAYGAPKAYAALGLADWSLFPAAFAKVLIGAGIYAISIVGLWLIVGHPEGPEQALLDRTGLKWRRWFARST